MSGLRTRLWVPIIVTAVGIAVLGTATLTGATGRSTAPAQSLYRLHEVDTSVVPVDNPPQGTSAGDLLVFTARVSMAGKRFGRYVGNCAFVTRTEIFCSIDLNVYGQGRIEFAGELSTQRADAVMAVTGGTGSFARARGYLKNHQTSTGTSADQVLYLDTE